MVCAYIWRSTYATMQNTGQVFRRFDSFEAAEDYAHEVRGKADLIRIIYSPYELPRDAVRGEMGPWVVKGGVLGDTPYNDAGDQKIVAWYPRKGRARKVVDRINWLKAHQASQR